MAGGVDLECTVKTCERQDSEGPGDVAYELQRDSLSQRAAAGLYEDRETAGVDELDGAKIDHEPLSRGGQQLIDSRVELTTAGEIDRSTNSQHHRTDPVSACHLEADLTHRRRD